MRVNSRSDYLHVFRFPRISSTSSRPRRRVLFVGESLSTASSVYALPLSLATYNVRDDPPRDELAVLVPVLSVLVSARFVVSSLAVHKKDDKVEQIEVGDRGVKAGRQGPR